VLVKESSGPLLPESKACEEPPGVAMPLLAMLLWRTRDSKV